MVTVGRLLGLLRDCLRSGPAATYIWRSGLIPGWTRGDEAVELARVSRALSDGAAIVELGSFLGGSAILLAGPRKLAGSGTVHCVDPFDGSGDSYSVPYYDEIRKRMTTPLRAAFDENIRAAGLADWIQVHPGTATTVARTWTTPINLLFMDGDHSVEGALSAYRVWSPHLKPGGILAIHNSTSISPNHDGSTKLVKEMIHPPSYSNIRLVGSTTFARKEA